MGEETKTETVAENGAAAEKPAKKKWPIVGGVVVVVLIAAGAGFWVWHEQPSFCNAICHTPMDSYNETYDQDPNTTGVDKWGNEVENTSSMLVVTHKAMGYTCLDCHTPVLSEQISEGINWVSGNYVYPLEEKSLDDLVEASGTEDSDEFCLNEDCHDMTREELEESTSDLTRNPHSDQHGEISCSTCHKAHRASVMYCTTCHDDAEVPTGWLSATEEAQLETSYAD